MKFIHTRKLFTLLEASTTKQDLLIEIIKSNLINKNTNQGEEELISDISHLVKLINNKLENLTGIISRSKEGTSNWKDLFRCENTELDTLTKVHSALKEINFSIQKTLPKLEERKDLLQHVFTNAQNENTSVDSKYIIKDRSIPQNVKYKIRTLKYNQQLVGKNDDIAKILNPDGSIRNIIKSPYGGILFYLVSDNQYIAKQTSIAYIIKS